MCWGCVSAWSDVDGLVCVCLGCVGRVWESVGDGQTVEYFVCEGLPLSWIVKLIVVIGWWLCVVGVVGDLEVVCVALYPIM